MEENINQDKNQYIREQVKQRPLNRKKLMRRTMITAAMAVIFGVFACFTFLVLEPVFSNLLSPEEEPDVVEIPEDTNEMLPEDMILKEEKPEEEKTDFTRAADEVDPLGDYSKMYEQIYAIAGEVEKSMVTVTSLNTDEDWWGDEYQSEGTSSGLYVANNGKEILILGESENILDADVISVTFFDGETVSGEIKEADENSGLCIVAVPISSMSGSTIDSIVPASLGRSRSSELMASPVIAIGRPYGSSSSVAFGMLTSLDTTVTLTDANYNLLTTNIYGSTGASGIIVNLSGEVLGIIDQSHNEDAVSNLISAIGISDLKKTIERMSNGRPKARFGIEGTSVTGEVHEAMGVPFGAYVTDIVMNSPAMNAGIQRGDVIIKMDSEEIVDYAGFTEYLSDKKPEEVIEVVIARQGQEEYREVTLSITLGEEKK